MRFQQCLCVTYNKHYHFKRLCLSGKEFLVNSEIFKSSYGVRPRGGVLGNFVRFCTSAGGDLTKVLCTRTDFMDGSYGVENQCLFFGGRGPVVSHYVGVVRWVGEGSSFLVKCILADIRPNYRPYHVKKYS